MKQLLLILVLLQVSLIPQLRIKAVGDILPGSYTPAPFIPKDSGKVFVDNIREYLTGGDIIFGNFEGTFAAQDDKPCKCSDSSRIKGICFEFGIPVYLLPAIKSLGFNVLNLDNNHSEDYGIKNYQKTKLLLKGAGILPAGKKEPVIWSTSDSVSVVIIPFGFSGKSFSVTHISEAKNIVSKYAAKYKTVIVSFHGGSEGKNALYVSDSMEVFYGEKRGSLIAFSKAVIDAGADLVIGHGPHVLRAMEFYKERLIAYSLGNFLTYGNINVNGVNGVTAILDVSLDSEGKFISGKIIPFVQNSPGIPVYDNKKQAIDLINRLSRKLKGGGNVTVNEDGEILRR